MPLIIDAPREESLANGVRRVSAQLGTQRLWFDLPHGLGTALRGEPFVIAALLPAMITGQPIVGHRDLPICPVLRGGLDHLQSILRLWGPVLQQELHPVAIDVPLAPPPPGGAAGAFFTGDLHTTYTWLDAPEPLSRSVYVRGTDLPLDHPAYDARLARNAAWLEARGAALLPMASNIREVGRAFGLEWSTYVGAAQGALGHVAGFGVTYLAATHRWIELWPNGSHPATDPHWSSATHRIVHHGNGASRWQKLERLAREPGALDLLHVCEEAGDRNCGRCAKCLRTMALLRILGLRAATLPHLEDPGQVARLTPRNRNESALSREAMELARARGNPDLAQAFARGLRRREVQRTIQMLKSSFVGGPPVAG